MNKLGLTDEQLEGIEHILLRIAPPEFRQLHLGKFLFELTEPDWMPEIEQVYMYRCTFENDWLVNTCKEGKKIKSSVSIERRQLNQSEVGTSWRPASDWDKAQGLVDVIKEAMRYITPMTSAYKKLEEAVDDWENPDE